MNEERPRLREPVSEADWQRGPADAEVTLVEYLDFQCPYCQRAYPIVEEVLASVRPEVRFVVRHFPVPSSHPEAEEAVYAAEAAGRQGKFWEMYHRLFEARGQFFARDLERYAEEVGLDLDRFRRDMRDPEIHEKVRRQKYLGLRSGVNGTPTLYLNEVRWDGNVDTEELREALQEARGRGRQAPA